MTGLAISVSGAQWGDEGKGAEVDRLARKVKMVVRYQGGGNAGHTICFDDKEYKLHVLPVGILHPGVEAVVGPCVLLDLPVVTTELGVAGQVGASVLIDSRAPIVLPIHKVIDEGRELVDSVTAIGTTKRGIGPCYEDMYSRRGVRAKDLQSSDMIVAALLRRGYYEEKVALANHLGMEEIPTLHETVDYCMKYADQVVHALGDSLLAVQVAIKNGGNVLFEGAQGVMLDVVHGSWPYATSSYCSLGGIAAMFGFHKVDRAIGVAKAYTTRVGAGPFPTELQDETLHLLREKGQEYGATTNRPRRCGWLDLPALKYGCRVGGIRELVITKLDVLSGFKEVKVCVGYNVGAHQLPPLITLTSDVLEQVKPDYATLPGWKEDISWCRKLEDLPQAARDYLDFISIQTSLPITRVGVGKDREQLIKIK